LHKNLLFNILLLLLVCLTVTVLTALNETRLDLYLSLYTLEYFVLTAVLRPRRRFTDFLGLALLTLFFVIVGFRIAEVLLS